jgi:hypothetical protein
MSQTTTDPFELHTKVSSLGEARRLMWALRPEPLEHAPLCDALAGLQKGPGWSWSCWWLHYAGRRSCNGPIGS